MQHLPIVDMVYCPKWKRNMSLKRCQHRVPQMKNDDAPCEYFVDITRERDNLTVLCNYQKLSEKRVPA